MHIEKIGFKKEKIFFFKDLCLLKWSPKVNQFGGIIILINQGNKQYQELENIFTTSEVIPYQVKKCKKARIGIFFQKIIVILLLVISTFSARFLQT